MMLVLGVLDQEVIRLYITRAAYATSVAFILMTIKGLLLLNERKHELYEEIFRDEFK